MIVKDLKVPTQALERGRKINERKAVKLPDCGELVYLIELEQQRQFLDVYDQCCKYQSHQVNQCTLSLEDS